MFLMRQLQVPSADRKNKSPFGATPLAVPPQRPPLEWRAARRSTAHRGLDMQLRRGEGAASRVVRGEGLGKGGCGRLRGARRERVVKVHNFAVQVCAAPRGGVAVRALSSHRGE